MCKHTRKHTNTRTHTHTHTHTHNGAFCLDKLVPGMNEDSALSRISLWVGVRKVCFELQIMDMRNITGYLDF